MEINKDTFDSLLPKFKDLHVLVIGDIMLDRYVWGDSHRVSEEAPVLIVDAGKREERLGGAGNVVNNLLNLGVKVSLAGVVGPDFYGEKVTFRLKELGVDGSGVITARDRPTTVKKRVISRGQQLIRIDTEKRDPISEFAENLLLDFLEEQLEDFDAVIISDYAKGVMTPRILNYFTKTIQEKNLGIDKCPIMLDPKPSNIEHYQGMTIIKPNQQEAEQISGIKIVDRDSRLLAAQRIRKTCNIDIVLLSSSEGLLICSERFPNGNISNSRARKIFDVSGAGDSVVSCFTVALAAGLDQTVAADISNIAAAYVISEVGTVPLTVQGIRQELEYFSNFYEH